MLIVMFPCDTAQAEILMRAVATIVPVRSLITIFAGAIPLKLVALAVL